MTGNQQLTPGRMAGFDLTVPDAEGIRDFYEAVIGWESEPLDMGGYSDYVMKAPGVEGPAAGICHLRGENADLPPYWLTYILVDDLDASLRQCAERGGSRVSAIRGNAGETRYCVIQDPAGAYLALMEMGAGAAG